MFRDVTHNREADEERVDAACIGPVVKKAAAGFARSI